MLSSKESFLKAFKDYGDEIKKVNWGISQNKYSTYAELEEAILIMSEEEFRDFLMTFPMTENKTLNELWNKYLYKKDIIKPLDKNVIITVDDLNNGRGLIDKSEFIQNDEYTKYNFSITTKDGIVTRLEHFNGRDITTVDPAPNPLFVN